MNCPTCGSSKDKVLDSRERTGGTTIRRRRQCIVCKRRWTTIEARELELDHIHRRVKSLRKAITSALAAFGDANFDKLLEDTNAELDGAGIGSPIEILSRELRDQSRAATAIETPSEVAP